MDAQFSRFARRLPAIPENSVLGYITDAQPGSTLLFLGMIAVLRIRKLPAAIFGALPAGLLAAFCKPYLRAAMHPF